MSARPNALVRWLRSNTSRVDRALIGLTLASQVYFAGQFIRSLLPADWAFWPHMLAEWFYLIPLAGAIAWVLLVYIALKVCK